MINTPVIDTLESEITHHQEAEPVFLAALGQLFQSLEQRRIRYCHWKSNVRLPSALQGKTDLDLLVDRKDAQRFREALGAHGIKPVLAPAGKRYPGLEDYIGLDQASGRIFHLHVHYRLVLGEQYVKNYRLPLEEQFLDSCRLERGVRVPAPELELMVLALRALLKYRDRDVVKDVMKIRTPGIPQEIQDEVQWLLAQTSVEQVARAGMDMDDVVPLESVLELLRTVSERPRDGIRLFRLRAQVRRALISYRRYSPIKARLIYAREYWRRRNTFLKFAPTLGMTPVNGGLTLALVGADGAGKSTMSQMLHEWLGQKMDAHSYYLGSKQPSQRSQLLYVVFRIARRSQRAAGRRLGDQHLISRTMARLRDNLLHLHHLSIGRDRYRRFQAGKTKALAGSIVMYDRYPLEAISSSAAYRLLDGPQIRLSENGNSNPIERHFAFAELRLYRAMELPEYLFILDVSPDISLARKPDHDHAAVSAKIHVIRDLVGRTGRSTQRCHMVRLNADLPLENVLAQLKREVWNAL